MSSSLWGETSYLLARKALSKVPYLCNPSIEPEFLLAIAIKLQSHVYSRLEPISTANLTVLLRGVAAKNGHILLVGSQFGADMLM